MGSIRPNGHAEEPVSPICQISQPGRVRDDWTPLCPLRAFWATVSTIPSRQATPPEAINHSFYLL
jgi:hypothetical protein